jgi:hypothetical protein
MLGGKGKGGRVGQRESPSGTEVSPCLRVANLQKIFFLKYTTLPPYPYCMGSVGGEHDGRAMQESPHATSVCHVQANQKKAQHAPPQKLK